MMVVFPNFIQAQCKVEVQLKAMGTEFVVQTQSPTCDSLQLLEFCRSRLAHYNMVFSDYRSDSEVSLLMANYSVGEWQEVSADLFEMLDESEQMSIQTKGYFDCTVGPLVKFWRRYKRIGEFHRKGFQQAKRAVGYRKVELDSIHKRVRFKRKQMALDFGGIAKGWIAQRLGAELKALGHSEILVDAGGDVFALAEEEVFTIALPNAFGESKALQNGALVVSGDWYRSVEFKGKKRSHIVNPRTGLGSSESKLVWVYHSEGAKADAWASALSVMPVWKGNRFIKRNGLEAAVIEN